MIYNNIMLYAFSRTSVHDTQRSILFLTLLLILYCIITPSSARAFTYLDGGGEGEGCPQVTACTPGHANFAGQDNGYHNKLQAMKGSMQKTYNIFESAPGDDTVNPPVPAQYTATPFETYTGVTGGYQYGGAGIPYTPSTPPTR